MMAPLERLIESLRNELQQYGELLALLDQQNQAVLFQGAADILHSMGAIHRQGQLVHKARQIRTEATDGLARSLDLAGGASFTALLPKVPDAYRPLLTALIQENNALLMDVRGRAARNQMLLQRSLEMMRHFLENIGTPEGNLIPLDLRGVSTTQSDGTFHEALA